MLNRNSLYWKSYEKHKLTKAKTNTNQSTKQARQYLALSLSGSDMTSVLYRVIVLKYFVLSTIHFLTSHHRLIVYGDSTCWW